MSQKAIMLRLKLRKRFLNDKTEESRSKEMFVYIYGKKVKKSKLTDSNKVWKTVTPIFYSKIKSKNSITFIEGPKIIQEGGELAKTFN